MSPPSVRVLSRSVGGSRHTPSLPLPAGRGSSALPHRRLAAPPCCGEMSPHPPAQRLQLPSWGHACKAVSGGSTGPRVEQGAAVGVVVVAVRHGGCMYKVRDKLHNVVNPVHANDGHGRVALRLSILPANLDPVAAKGIFICSARDVVVQHEGTVHGNPADLGAEEAQQPAVCAVLEATVTPALAKDLATTASNP